MLSTIDYTLYAFLYILNKLCSVGYATLHVCEKLYWKQAIFFPLKFIGTVKSPSLGPLLNTLLLQILFYVAKCVVASVFANICWVYCITI